MTCHGTGGSCRREEYGPGIVTLGDFHQSGFSTQLYETAGSWRCVASTASGPPDWSPACLGLQNNVCWALALGKQGFTPSFWILPCTSAVYPPPAPPGPVYNLPDPLGPTGRPPGYPHSPAGWAGSEPQDPHSPQSSKQGWFHRTSAPEMRVKVAEQGQQGSGSAGSGEREQQ